MTYTQAAVLGVAAAVVVDVALLRTRLLRRGSFWLAYLILLAGQLAVNGVLTGRRVVRYNPSDILGVRLVFAPIEDLGFGFALVVCTLSVWTWLGGRGVRRDQDG